MIVCAHNHCKKIGRDKHGNQRFRCLLCGKTFLEERIKPLGDMRIEVKSALMVLKMMVEGVSIRSIERLTGINRNTVLSLLELVGQRAQMFWQKRMTGLRPNRVEVDEVWAFIGCKEKLKQQKGYGEELGDCYTFTAIDPETKLMLAYHNGKRTNEDAQFFCEKLRACTVGHYQLTTDGFKGYNWSVLLAFGAHVDYAQIIKIFGKPRGKQDAARTYSPAEITGVRRRDVIGKPNRRYVSTSMVERSNLTWRMRSRRMTRLTNAHSKKWENHEYAVVLMLTVYNYVTIHGTLKTTPAVAAGLTDRPWTMEELLTELAAYA